VSTFPQKHLSGEHYFRFEFYLVNAGSLLAINVQGGLLLGVEEISGGSDACAGAILPGNRDKVRILFDVPDSLVAPLFGISDAAVRCRLSLRYCTPSGQSKETHLPFTLAQRAGSVQFEQVPVTEFPTIAALTD
jgi:hypothetical protein